MKQKRLFITLIYTCLIVFVTTKSRAKKHEPNPAVLDSSGNPIRRTQKYFIKTTINGSNPMATLYNRTTSSQPPTLSVGLEDDVSIFSSGLPLVLSPFTSGEKVVRENKNFKISFSNSESVIAWKVGLKDSKNERRFIVTGDNVGYANYFYVTKLGHGNEYGLRWCPAEICNTCTFICGNVGVFAENGKRFLALDVDSALPIVFVNVKA